MGYPEHEHDEPIILKSRNVRYKSISFDAVLTSRRIYLTASKNNVIPSQEIEVASIRNVETEENAIRDHFLLLTLVTSEGEQHQAVLTFARQAGVERKRECNEWAKKLKSLISPSTPVTAPRAVPAADGQLSPKREIPLPAPGTPAETRPAKKKTEIARQPGKVIEKGPVAEPQAPVYPPSGAFCSGCGSRVPLKSTFCNKCGAPIKPPAESVQELHPEVPSEPVSVHPGKYKAEHAKKEAVQAPAPKPVITKQPETVQRPAPEVSGEQKSGKPPAPGPAMKPETLHPPAPEPARTKKPGRAPGQTPQVSITKQPEDLPSPPQPVLTKQPETVPPPAQGVSGEQKSGKLPAPRQGIAKKPETLHHPVPKPALTKEPGSSPPPQPVVTRERETALPPAVQHIVTPKPDSVPLPVPEPVVTQPQPVIKKQPDSVPLPVPEPVVTQPQPVPKKQPDSVSLPTPEPVVARVQEPALLPAAEPVITPKPDTVSPPIPQPVQKQPDSVPLPTPELVVARVQEPALLPAAEPVITPKPDTVSPPIPQPVQKQPDSVSLPTPEPVVTREKEPALLPAVEPVITPKPDTVSPPIPQPVLKKQPDRVSLPTPEPVVTREQEPALLPAAEPVITPKPETVSPPIPQAVIKKQPDRVPPPAGSRGTPAGSPAKPVIPAAELQKKGPEPRVRQPASPVQVPSPQGQSDLSSAASRVVWPVFPSPDSPELPAKEAVPAKPAPVPPRPIAAHDGKKPNYLAIGILIMAILPILAGLVIVANIMSVPGDAEANITPIPTASPAFTTQPTSAPGTPAATITPVPGSAQVPGTGVWVRVSYPGTYIGLIGMPGNQTEVTDTGDHIYQIPAGERAVAAVIQKNDDSGDQIILEVYNNGVLLRQESSVAPKGIVEILLDLKRP